jgi:hypothetical protein
LDRIQSEYILSLVKKQEVEAQKDSLGPGSLFSDTIKCALRSGNVNTRNIFTVHDKMNAIGLAN